MLISYMAIEDMIIQVGKILEIKEAGNESSIRKILDNSYGYLKPATPAYTECRITHLNNILEKYRKK